MNLTTRYSEVKAFRRCQKLHEYAYIQRIQRVRAAAAPHRGTIIHELLNARARIRMGEKTPTPNAILAEYEKKHRALFAEERELYGENFMPDIRRVFEGYERTWSQDGWIYEHSELEIETTLGPKLPNYHGTLDKIIRTKDGRRWLVDHKSHKSIPTEEQRFQDYQMLLYVWAWNRECDSGEEIDGIIWDYLRTKAPTVPEQLKNGQLTQRANLDSDYFTYMAELKRLRLDPGLYAEYLKGLRQRSVDRFYLRVPLPKPSKAMTESVVEDFRSTTRAIVACKRPARTMTKDCSWCEFYRLCTAELRGHDSNYILKSEYEERKDEETVEEDEPETR
jgi:hypothetical protein